MSETTMQSTFKHENSKQDDWDFCTVTHSMTVVTKRLMKDDTGMGKSIALPLANLDLCAQLFLKRSREGSQHVVKLAVSPMGRLTPLHPKVVERGLSKNIDGESRFTIMGQEKHAYFAVTLLPTRSQTIALLLILLINSINFVAQQQMIRNASRTRHWFLTKVRAPLYC
jgi:hypothetical protein